MKPALLVDAFYVVCNIAVCATVGLTLGLPRLDPPVDLFGPYVSPLRSRRAASALPNVRQERIGIFVEEQALGMLLDTATLARAERPQLFFLGASSAAVGCRPRLLQPLLPDYQSNNLAIAGATATVMRQTVDEVIRALPIGVRTRSAIVLGISYPIFMLDEVRWHKPTARAVAASTVPTCVDYARWRCPPLLDATHPVGRTLPATVIDIAKQRCRIWQRFVDSLPSIPGSSLPGLALWRTRLPSAVRRRIAGTAATPAAKTFTEMTLEEQVDSIDQGMGPPGLELDGRQGEQLTALIREAVAAGMQVMVIDLPLPSRHRSAAPRFEPFKRRLRELLAPFIDDGTACLFDLTDALGDEHFADLAHPATDSLETWATLIADTLRPLLRSPSASVRE